MWAEVRPGSCWAWGSSRSGTREINSSLDADEELVSASASAVGVAMDETCQLGDIADRAREEQVFKMSRFPSEARSQQFTR